MYQGKKTEGASLFDPAESLRELRAVLHRLALALGERIVINGVGKILAGAITGAGNLLLFGGTIVAPNPGTAYAVIGSSALAVGSICQGLGDLRGDG